MPMERDASINLLAGLFRHERFGHGHFAHIAGIGLVAPNANANSAQRIVIRRRGFVAADAMRFRDDCMFSVKRAAISTAGYILKLGIILLKSGGVGGSLSSEVQRDQSLIATFELLGHILQSHVSLTNHSWHGRGNSAAPHIAPSGCAGNCNRSPRRSSLHPTDGWPHVRYGRRRRLEHSRLSRAGD